MHYIPCAFEGNDIKLPFSTQEYFYANLYRKITNLASLTVDKEEINIPHSLRGLKISSAKNSKYFNVGRINRRILKFPLKSCVLGAVNFVKRLRRFFFLLTVASLKSASGAIVLKRIDIKR